MPSISSELRHTTTNETRVRSRAGVERSPTRVVIENVSPEIDGGQFPIKRTIGEEVVAAADIYADGHDVLAAVLRWRFVGTGDEASFEDRSDNPRVEPVWHEVPMVELGNDRWTGRFTVTNLGRYEYTIEAWIDAFASWRRDLAKKWSANQDVTNELAEGAHMVLQAAQQCARPRSSEDPHEQIDEAAGELSDAEWLEAQAERLDGSGRRGGGTPAGAEGAAVSDAVAARVDVALGEQLATKMRRYTDRSRGAAYGRVLSVTVERERARYGAWYELFPRSAGDDPGQHGTFRDVERRLPEIAAMGFDVLYLPPVHPIGRSYRKGPNNALTAGPNDPGSPWAIGAEEGGHKDIHPKLGTIAEFDRLVEEAARHGIEIALDIAYQCSPDHPYVREHPEWFRHRVDGSIKYAENPPKKYQDIYPIDFECDDWPALWEELKSVVLYWIDHGVRIFRVDNPHTKPFRFWEWLIREVRAEHPDAIFLSEAFTRPKVMRQLAKAGFAQSYTYFTWRNTKQELTEYFTELTGTDVREYMRPNLFANTPDILHEYLQYGGRPAFQVRLVLAATLGASYGIYGPAFELCENRAVKHGSEEYLDSEKYQIRRWDRDQPGTIRHFVRRVNEIRRANPALHWNNNLQFYSVDNDQLIFYGKCTPDYENIVLVVVNLDPHHVHSGWVQVPLAEFGIGPNDSYQVHDLISDARYLWHGATNFVRLDPSACPAHIFRLRRRIKTERDFDYFM